MPAFPTLSMIPTFPLDPDGSIEDAVIRSPMTAGYSQTRPRYTRSRRGFGVNYRDLPDADVALLRTFEITTLRNGADSFTWVHPITAVSYTVQLTGPIKFSKANGPTVGNVQFALLEV